MGKFSTLNSQLHQGFTLVEILLVMAIFAIFVGFTTINLIKPQVSASIDSATTTLVADIKQQQIKAMAGDSDSSFGVHFESDKYVLFSGSYSSSQTSNFTVNLDSVLTFSSFPSEITFAKRSGETSSATVVIVHNQTGDQKTLTINKLGAIEIN